MHLLLFILVALVAISIIPTVFSGSLRGEFTIPDWVKNTAGWWSDDKIPDSSFIEMIEFLIKEEIITVQIPAVDSVVEEIPGWVKNTAGWWAEDKIHDVTFVAAVRYLVSQGIVYVEQEVVEPVEEVVEITDFYMEVNSGSCTYCVSWAYVGKEYNFQIETYDEKRGNYIDGVEINVKIISKGGELRHNFGQVTTEDGIYKNSITIPSMDWYAENILFVTGEYYGVEKTIEKEFTVFKKGYSADQSTSNTGGSCTEVSPKSVASQETIPTGIAFSNDGLKMFIVGFIGDDVNEYTLNGAYCLGTASFVDAFSVASEEFGQVTAPTGIAFSTDGLKMFILGAHGDDVNEYTLSENFDVSTASFVDAFSVASQDLQPAGIAFSTDGLKMLIVGNENNKVYEYTLSEHFDVSTASFVDAFNVTSQDGAPRGIAFSNDGLKMFIVGNENNKVYEYTLSEHFDVSTASFADFFKVTSQDTEPFEIAFDPSGRYMFILGSQHNDVTVYKLSENFDVSTAVVQSG